MNLTELLLLCDRKFCIAGEWGALVRWINAYHPNPYRGKPVKWMPGCWAKEK